MYKCVHYGMTSNIGRNPFAQHSSKTCKAGTPCECTAKTFEEALNKYAFVNKSEQSFYCGCRGWE